MGNKALVVKSFNLLVICLFTISYVFALQIGEKQIKNFEKEATKFIKWLFKQDLNRINDSVSISITGKKYNQVNLDNLDVTFETVSKDLEDSIKSDNFSFEQFHKFKSVSVRAKFSEATIQDFILHEIDRVKPEKRIFDKVLVTLLDGKVRVAGYINIANSPVSLLAKLFKSQPNVFFEAILGIKITDSQITVEIIEGKINNQDLSSELKQQFLSWLNPVWDFTQMSFKTEVKYFNIANNIVELDIKFSEK